MVWVQAEGEGVLAQAEYQPLVQGLWARQTAALERASPSATAAAAEAREVAAKELEDLPEQPSWVRPLLLCTSPLGLSLLTACLTLWRFLDFMKGERKILEDVGADGRPYLLHQVCGGRLHKHQLAAVNTLRQRWAGGGSLLLADDSGLGKSTSFIAFVQSLRCAHHPLWPRCLTSSPARCTYASKLT